MPGKSSWILAVIVSLALGLASGFFLQLVRDNVSIDGLWGPLINLGLMATILLAAGFLLGLYFSGQSPLGAWQPALLGILVVAPIVILQAVTVVADISKDPTSHNLWPFEFLIVGFGALVTVAGAYVGWSFARNGKSPRA